MKLVYWLSVAAIFGFGLCGCKEAATDKSKAASPRVEKPAVQDTVAANLDKLDPADRKLAKAQGFCAVDDDSRLGSMGVPLKVMVNDQPVFVCCKSCKKSALAHPEKTLAKVEELKKKSAGQ